MSSSVSPSPVLQAEQRAWHYWFADGLINLLVGAGILLMSFCVLYPPRWPPSLLPMAAWALALWLYMAIVLRHQRIVEWLKTRTTYPRTGYVQTPADACEANLLTVSVRENAPGETVQSRSARRRNRLIMLGLVLLANLGMLAIHQRWFWTVEGVIVGVAMVIVRKQSGLSWIVPLGFPLLGLYLTFYAASWKQVPSYFLLGWGVLFMLDGAITLIRYLLQNPAPNEPAA